MPGSTDTKQKPVPKHLWIVGIIALLWSAMGAFDYLMTQTRNDAYMSNFTPEQLEFFYGLPAWTVAFWAIGVWGGLLGAILLLLRNKLAVWVFVASLTGVVVSMFQNYVLDDGMEVVGDPVSLGFTFVIIAIAVALLVYARAMTGRGVLN
jgi:hypothetical protein